MKLKNPGFPILALLGSSTTLICCVLPALLVTLGFGSVVAGVIGAVPQITWLSENKGIVFGIAGILVAASGLWEFKRRNDPCPLDPNLAKACMKLRKISLILWIVSAVVLSGSAFFVFVLPQFLN